MRDEYKFKPSDFIPVVGIFSYINRAQGGAYSLKSNLSPKNKPIEYAEFHIKSWGLVIYNVAILTPLVMGLEKLLQ